MLARKQYINAVRGFTLVYETLTYVYMQSFMEWLADRHVSNHIPESVWTQLTETYSSERIRKWTSKTFLSNVETLCKESATFKFWKMLLDALELLLQRVWAFCEGNWKLHIQIQCAMILYYFVAWHWIAFSYQMRSSLLSCLENSVWFWKQAYSIGHIQYPSDMGMEKTIIKGKGGIAGITRQKAALIR